jgi:pheromone shutdown-related protein TraB
MRRFKNIMIIGTSHISSKSILEIENQFRAYDPDIVAVELDRGRLHALLHNAKPNYSLKLINQIGLTGYLFAILGSILQKKLGDIVGIVPGSEMLRASMLARESKKRLALIDQEIAVTLKRLSKEFTFKEKIRLLFDIFLSPFSKKIKFEISSVPEKKLIIQVLELLRKRYPGLHKALIEERNQYMARRLALIMQDYPEQKILAVVGAGHEEGLSAILEMELHKLSSTSGLLRETI